jgi:mono/diheme cytochrome c family protein
MTILVRFCPTSRSNPVRGFLITFKNTATLLSLLLLTATSVAATESESKSIRVGFMVATERCAACHIASPHQTLTPLFPDAPKFEDIANRPTTSQETLVKYLGSAHGTSPGATNAPPPGGALQALTDQEKSAVASYILSLRNYH